MASTQVHSQPAHSLWRDPTNEASSSSIWSQSRPGEIRQDKPAPQYYRAPTFDSNPKVNSENRSFELPALPSMAMSSRISPATPRLAGVSSILNHPTEDYSDDQRRRKSPRRDSPEPGRQTLPPIVTKLEDQSAIPRAPSPSNSSTTSTDKAPRRILTPVSPSSHRGGSLSSVNVSTRENLFATSPVMKTYCTQSGAATPSMAALPASSIPFNHPTPYRSEHGSRRASIGPSQCSTTVSASPQMPYSPYTDMSGMLSEGNDGQAIIPVSTSGPSNAVRLMTLKTASGTMQVPVDVQQASRAADEKRRRNAGASARFRQRRKEKERESTSTISRLEQSNRELREDADYYRSERDYFRAIVQSQPGWEQHFPRPQSPRLRRSTSRAPLALPAPDDSVKQEPPSPAQTEPRSVDSQVHSASWQQFPSSHDMSKMGNPSTPAQPNNIQHSAAPQQSMPAFHHAANMPHHPHHGMAHQQPPQRQEQHRYEYQHHPQHHGQPHVNQTAHQPPPHHQHHQGPPPTLHAVPQTGPNNPFATERPFNGHEHRSQ